MRRNSSEERLKRRRASWFSARQTTFGVNSMYSYSSGSQSGRVSTHGAIRCGSAARGRVEGWGVGPILVALGVADVGFVAREDVAPVGAAGVDVVFVGEAPTICSRVRRRVGRHGQVEKARFLGSAALRSE